MENSVNQSILKLIYAFKTRMKLGYESSGSTLAPMHLRAIQKIDAIEDCTSQKVAELMQRDKSQVTRLISELLERELITKAPNPNDKRSQFLTLTVNGEAQLVLLLKVESAAITALTEDLNSEEIELLIGLIDKMVGN